MDQVKGVGRFPLCRDQWRLWALSLCGEGEAQQEAQCVCGADRGRPRAQPEQGHLSGELLERGVTWSSVSRASFAVVWAGS